MEDSCTLCGMDQATRDHAERLRRAMAEHGIKAVTLADMVPTTTRTVGNWTSRKKPTMPKDTDLAKLRRIFGDYDRAGDPVETAIRRSDLIEWRQDTVIAFYKRNLHEQGDGARHANGGGGPG